MKTPGVSRGMSLTVQGPQVTKREGVEGEHKGRSLSPKLSKEQAHALNHVIVQSHSPRLSEGSVLDSLKTLPSD